MTIIHQPALLQHYLAPFRQKDFAIGFVPTMGALHDGHIGLIQQSKRQTKITVCSIFVNPTQFNDTADFKKYPVRLENDIRLLERAGNNVLFVPPVDAIYTSGLTGLENYDLGFLETVLEGKYRPGHFQGVCQVMKRLLTAVEPDLLFMGEKDYQQCMVIQRLIDLEEMEVKLVTCPTQREKDGLAMSSRNLRLTEKERSIAPEIFKTLREVKQKFRQGNITAIKDDAVARLQSAGFRVDYLEIADAVNLQSITAWDGSTPAVALVAAFLGEVRLIDNMSLTS